MKKKMMMMMMMIMIMMIMMLLMLMMLVMICPFVSRFPSVLSWWLATIKLFWGDDHPFSSIMFL